MSKTATVPAADREVKATDNQPDPFDAHVMHADSLYEEVGHWADGAEIENEKQAEAVDRLINDVKDAIEAAEAARDETIKPLTAQVTAARERWYPLVGDTQKVTGKLIRAKKALLACKTVWGDRLRAKQAAEAARLRAEATEAARIASEAARDAVGDLEATEQAEDLIATAQQALRGAAIAEKAKPKGFRDNWAVTGVTDDTALLRHYWQTNRQAIVAAARGLADVDVRQGKRTIPGVTIENRPYAV